MITLFLSFFLGENSSGGSRLDSEITKPFIESFNLGLINGLNTFIKTGQIHSPIFYYLIFSLNKFFGSNVVGLLYVAISSIIPFIFYKILVVKFNKTDKHYLFSLSMLIFLSPYFRSSACWLTNDNLALLFFCISILNFLKVKNNIQKLSIELYLCFIFLALSAYIRQYYGLFIIIYFLSLLKNKNYKLVFKCICLNIFLSIPFFVYLNMFYNYHGKFFNSPNPTTNNAFENIPFVFSILIFYLSIIFFSIKNNLSLVKRLFNENLKSLIILCIFYILFLSFLDIENYIYGGGIIFKTGSILGFGILTTLIFSFLSIIILYLILDKFIENYFIIFILILISFELVFQKYYDPLFFILLFSLLNSKIILKIVKDKKLNIKILYFLNFTFLILCNLYYYYLINIIK